MIQDQLCVGEDARGREITVDVFRFKGSDATAPKAYFQAGIHGDELQGSLALLKLKKLLEGAELKGDVTLIPSCNPLAQNNLNGYHITGRYDPIEGDNWNRFYLNGAELLGEFTGQNNQDLKAYLQSCIAKRLADSVTRAERMNLVLQHEALNADVMFDLHTDCISKPYVFAPCYAEQSAALFGLPYVLLMDNDFGGCFDEAMFCPFWSASDSIDGVEPIEAFTLECGSAQTLGENAADTLAQNLLNYLAHQGIVDAGQKPAPIKPIVGDSGDFRKLYAPKGGFYSWQVQPGDQVKQGDVLATIQTNTGDHVFASPCDGHIVNLFAPQALPQGAPAVKLIQC